MTQDQCDEFEAGVLKTIAIVKANPETIKLVEIKADSDQYVPSIRIEFNYSLNP